MFAKATKRPPPTAESSESDLEIVSEPPSAKKVKNVSDTTTGEDDDEVQVVTLNRDGTLGKENVAVGDRIELA